MSGSYLQKGVSLDSHIALDVECREKYKNQNICNTFTETSGSEMCNWAPNNS